MLLREKNVIERIDTIINDWVSAKQHNFTVCSKRYQWKIPTFKTHQIKYKYYKIRSIGL